MALVGTLPQIFLKMRNNKRHVLLSFWLYYFKYNSLQNPCVAIYLTKTNKILDITELAKLFLEAAHLWF